MTTITYQYLNVKWTSKIYTLQSSQKLGEDFIKSDDLVCDAVYLNSLYNFKQWFTPYEDEK